MGNLPPVEPPNLRRNRSGGQGNYQNQEPDYPPPNDDYLPQQSSNQYPPPDDRYPPPDRDGYVDLDDPQYGGQPRQPSHDRQPRRDDPYLDAPPSLGSIDSPTLGGGRTSRGRDSDDYDEPPRRRPRQSQGLSERQVEYLAWGSTILLLGISMMQALTGSSGFLRFFFPLLAGLILSASSIYQRVVRGWHVGPLTWLIAGLLVSYTITLQIAGDGTGIFKWIAYFIGTLIIMTGLLLILQIFRRQ